MTAPDLDQELKALRAEVEALNKQMKEIRRRGPGEKVEDLKAKGEAAAARAEERAKALATEIEKHPLGSALIALGIGFVVGRLIGR